MSLMRSLYIGRSAITSHGEAIGVVGDNVANVSTVGFRGSRARFADVLDRAAVGGGRSGAGTRIAGVQTLFGQGAIARTSVATDLAIEGDGFFAVAGNVSGVEGTFYTRAGGFTLDADGRVVNAQGLRLQGYAADSTGAIGSELGDLVVPSASMPATATTSVDVAANLDAGATAPAAAWDPTDPGGTSNYSTTVTVYDSLGAAHRAEVYFRKTGSNAWEWHAMVDGAETSGGTPGTPTEIGTGTLTFTPSGALDTETPAPTPVSFTDAEPGQSITFDFGDAITTDSGTGTSGTTQHAAPSSIAAVTQDGSAAGTIASIAIDDEGQLEGVFTNGQRRALGQVAVARFAAQDGLDRLGSSLFGQTSASGDPTIGAPGSGGRGSIVSGALEQSNVDLTEQFVDMIAYERAFQAGSRVVTTAQSMLEEVVSLKR